MAAIGSVLGLNAGLPWAAGSSPTSARGKRVKRTIQSPPNIIVINTDDQGNDLSAMWAVRALLVKGGTTFTNSITTDPLCCPSRATFLTGQYAHNHGVISNDPGAEGGPEPLFADRRTLPVALRKVGYRTALVGKYLNGYGLDDPTLVPPGWTQWHALTSPNEQRRWGYRLNRNGRVRRYGRFLDGLPARQYVTDVLARTAARLVDRWAPKRRPFFIWFNPTAPHGEGTAWFDSRDPRPAPRHRGLFEDRTLPRPPSFDEADVSDKPLEVQERPRLDAAAIAELEINYRSRLESLRSVDQAVLKMVRRLRKRRELGRTVIVFTSDNGYVLGEHRLRFKNHPYEESVQVPLVIRGPGFPRGAVRHHLVTNVDVPRTLLQIAGARLAGRRLDGRSLLSIARDRRVLTYREILYENYFGYQSKGFVAVRTPRYVLIERVSGERELYDLRRDPFELQSQHANPDYDRVEARLANRLAALRYCSGYSCRRADKPLPSKFRKKRRRRR